MDTITRVTQRAITGTVTFPTASTTFAACTWEGHCLGASCASNDDCDNDWVCANKICSPCCETQSTSAQVTTQTVTATAPGNPPSANPSANPSGNPLGNPSSSIRSSAIPSSTVSSSATPSRSSSGGLGTVAIIGIGVGAGLVVLLLVGAGLWWCRSKRRQSVLVEAPDSNQRSELEGVDHYGGGDRKRPFATGPAELRSDAEPTELQAVELAELDASSAAELEERHERQPEFEDVSPSRVHQETGPFVPLPEQVAALRSPQAGLEEHAISPEMLSSRQWSASPVSPEQRYVYTSPNGIRTDYSNSGVLRQDALPQQSYVAYHLPETERQPSGYTTNRESTQMEADRGDAVSFGQSEQPHWPLRHADAGPVYHWQHDHDSIRQSTLSGATTPHSRSEDAFLHWPNQS